MDTEKQAKTSSTEDGRFLLNKTKIVRRISRSDNLPTDHLQWAFKQGHWKGTRIGKDPKIMPNFCRPKPEQSQVLCSVEHSIT